MYCKHCGNQLADTAKFCGKCGKNVESKTEEKITNTAEILTYAPARIWRRFGNYVLDRIFVTIILIALSVLFVYSGASSTWLGIFVWIAPFLYFVFFEGIWQKTISKFITKTKVVMKDGRKPPLKNILGRSLARYIPFEPFSFLIGSHPMGWHDRLSNTLVVPSNYTEDDVKRIDIDKVKKMGGGNTAVVIVVAIVGLLVVIAIIGILSSVVLVSLNSARQKGQDAKIISVLSQMRVNAEVYYGDNKNSYSYAQDCNSGVFLKQNMQQLISDIPNGNVNCYAETSSYAISAKLATLDKSYCVDSSGYSNNGVAVDNGTTASCKLDTNVGTNSSNSWQTFNSVQDNFSILLPSYPKFDSQQYNDSTVPYVTDSYESVYNGDTYYIYKYKYQSDINAKPEALLEASLNVMVNADKNNKLVSSDLGVFGYYTSLDFHISNMGDDLKGKIVLEDQSNMFLVMLESTNFDEANYNKFMNSFTIK